MKKCYNNKLFRQFLCVAATGCHSTEAIFEDLTLTHTHSGPGFGQALASTLSQGFTVNLAICHCSSLINSNDLIRWIGFNQGPDCGRCPSRRQLHPVWWTVERSRGADVSRKAGALLHMLKPLEGKWSSFITSSLLATGFFHFVLLTANYVSETSLTAQSIAVIPGGGMVAGLSLVWVQRFLPEEAAGLKMEAEQSQSFSGEMIH